MQLIYGVVSGMWHGPYSHQRHIQVHFRIKLRLTM